MSTSLLSYMTALDDRITVTLHQLVHRIDAHADELLLERFGISFSRFHFLGALATMQTDDSPDLTEFAECLGVSKAAVSKRVPALVAAGWLTATPGADRSRRLVLGLTDAGHAIVDQASAALDSEFTNLFRDSDLDITTLHRDLRGALAVLEASDAAPDAAPAPDHAERS